MEIDKRELACTGDGREVVTSDYPSASEPKSRRYDMDVDAARARPPFASSFALDDHQEACLRRHRYLRLAAPRAWLRHALPELQTASVQRQICRGPRGRRGACLAAKTYQRGGAEGDGRGRLQFDHRALLALLPGRPQRRCLVPARASPSLGREAHLKHCRRLRALREVQQQTLQEHLRLCPVDARGQHFHTSPCGRPTPWQWQRHYQDPPGL